MKMMKEVQSVGHTVNMKDVTGFVLTDPYITLVPILSITLDHFTIQYYTGLPSAVLGPH